MSIPISQFIPPPLFPLGNHIPMASKQRCLFKIIKGEFQRLHYVFKP